MASCKHLGIRTRGEQVERFVQTARRFIVEVCWDHAVLPADVTATVLEALVMAFQTRSGLRGISMWRTPSDDNASHTAFTMQGVEPMVPASPTPFTPIGFTGDGVTVRSSVNSGKK